MFQRSSNNTASKRFAVTVVGPLALRVRSAPRAVLFPIATWLEVCCWLSTATSGESSSDGRVSNRHLAARCRMSPAGSILGRSSFQRPLGCWLSNDASPRTVLLPFAAQLDVGGGCRMLPAQQHGSILGQPCFQWPLGWMWARGCRMMPVGEHHRTVLLPMATWLGFGCCLSNDASGEESSDSPFSNGHLAGRWLERPVSICHMAGCWLLAVEREEASSGSPVSNGQPLGWLSVE